MRKLLSRLTYHQIRNKQHINNDKQKINSCKKSRTKLIKQMTNLVNYRKDKFNVFPKFQEPSKRCSHKTDKIN